jgi:type IV secretory pathway VirB2 component (pilin)
MPFYIRKSVSAGPFRFNLSKSGIGVSAGIKGLRIGTGPRGHYIHAGRGGLYYRSSIPGGSRADTKNAVPSTKRSSPDVQTYAEPGVEMVRVSSRDVMEMEDARFAEILSDLNAKQNSTSMRVALGWGSGAVGILATLVGGVTGMIIGMIFVGAAFLVGAWLDSFRRTSVLMYELEDEARVAYEALTSSFDTLMACVGKWHIDAGGTVQDIHAWKRNAGAGHILDKRPTTFDYSLPRVVTSNITPPAIQSGKETLYFLPDFLLVVERDKVGAVAYDGLSIRAQESHFIEEGTVPSDTTVISHTWKHPNKSGGPDRRFANNFQIPVCIYESIHLTSSNGLNELLQVSRNGITAPFARAVAALAIANGSRSHVQDLPRLT